jgi:hypothetical protein
MIQDFALIVGGGPAGNAEQKGEQTEADQDHGENHGLEARATIPSA